MVICGNKFATYYHSPKFLRESEGETFGGNLRICALKKSRLNEEDKTRKKRKVKV